MAEKMKKRDQIKMKNKMKITKNFKILKYARYLSLFIPCLVLLMLFVQSGFTTSNIQNILTEQPIMTASLVICIVNLLVFYQIGNLLQYLDNLEHLESVRIQLFIIAIAQLVMFNVVAFLMYVYALYRYFRWDSFSISQSYVEIKTERQMSNVVTLFVTLFIFCALELLLVYLFQ